MSVSIEKSPNQILSIRMQGSIDKADVQQIFAAFKQQTEAAQKLRIYLELIDVDFEQLPLEVYLEDLRLWLKHPGLLTQIDKAALVSDQAWLKALFELECALIPGLQGKNFEADQTVAARSWLSKSSVSTCGLRHKLALRLPGSLEFSWPQTILYASAKSLSGLALGLWLANRLAPQQRKRLGSVALVLGLVAGISVARQISRQFSSTRQA